MDYLTMEQLEAGLAEIRRSPADTGVVKLVVRRPRVGEREVLTEAALDPAVGLVGDNWQERYSPPDPETQVNVMNARAIALLAQTEDRWPLAGDQLFVDLDLSVGNLPPGTLLQIGTATLRVSEEPHTGCRKFVSRFGVDAMKFVNSPTGRSLNLRGINARIVEAGTVRPGDVVKKVVR